MAVIQQLAGHGEAHVANAGNPPVHWLSFRLSVPGAQAATKVVLLHERAALVRNKIIP
jgi:hypothetical protein